MAGGSEGDRYHVNLLGVMDFPWPDISSHGSFAFFYTVISKEELPCSFAF